MTKNILSLSANDAMDFLMKSENYQSFELPEYFDFTKILSFARKRVGDAKYEDCVSDADVASMTDANYELLLNKDGKYGVRPLTLVNPYLYYFLCREICEESHWTTIQECFKSFGVPHITSCAMPVIPAEKESFHKSTVILNWWSKMEQRSLELSLQYRYMFVSDITNCYGSINPEAIKWAMSLKDTSMANKKNRAFSDNIIKLIKQMQQGRNIGIPQGSVLFDFISEIVLGYSDLLLHETIQKMGKEGMDMGDYEILRYRDDYHIFCNDKDKLERLSYTLQQVMERLGFRMNTQKTFISDSIITDSIKQDKLFYIFNTPIFNKKGCDFDGIEKHFLYLLMFARKHPNAGQLKNMLSDLDRRIENFLKPKKKKVKTTDPENGTSVELTKTFYPHIKENKRAIIAVATQLAVENISVANYVLRIISRLLKDIEDKQERKDIIALVYARLRHQPNSTYTQVWLQNITFLNDKENHESPYDLPLCKLVMGERTKLWNNTWLKPALTKGFPLSSIVDKATLRKNDSIIIFKETRAYREM